MQLKNLLFRDTLINVKRIVILGSTGSIGTQTLDVIHQHPSTLKVVGLAAKSNANLLAQQAAKFGVKQVVLSDEQAESKDGIKRGNQAMIDMVAAPRATTLSSPCLVASEVARAIMPIPPISSFALSGFKIRPIIPLVI